MTCLVTGGTGFIGSWVAKAILEAGHKVVVFDLNPNMTIFNTVLGDRAKEITIVQGDLTQLYTVLNVIKQHNVTHIAHIAAAVLKVCAANPPLAMQINVMGMTNMLEACRIMGSAWSGHRRPACSAAAGMTSRSPTTRASARMASMAPAR